MKNKTLSIICFSLTALVFLMVFDGSEDTDLFGLISLAWIVVHTWVAVRLYKSE